MPFRTLSMAMDRYNHPIADEALEFHLERVLEPDGLVELRKVRDLSAELREFDRRSPDAIDAVKLTRRGITALNEPEKFEEVERP
jgi:hypothetical protein